MKRITNQEAAKSLGTDVESLKKQLQGKKRRNEASVKALPEINSDEVIKRRIRDLTTPNGWIRKLTQEELGIFTETVLTAVNRTPVFREGFALLSPFVDATAETCYTDQHARVGLSYRFLYALDPSTRATWLTHEVMHLLNNHFTRFATAGVRAARANIVGDLEINTCLHANRTMTTSHMLLPQDYDLKKFKTMEWYNANWNAQLDQILSRDESRMQQSDASSSSSSPSQDSGCSGDQSSSAKDDGSMPDQMSSGGGSGDSDSDSQDQQSQNDSGGSGSGSSSGDQQSSDSSQGSGGSSQSQPDEWSDPSEGDGSGQSQSGSSSSQSQGSSGSGSGSQSDDSNSEDGSQQGDSGSSNSSQNGNNDGGDTDPSSSQSGNNSNDASSGSSQNDADDQSQNGSGNGGQQNESSNGDDQQSGNSGGGSSSKRKRRGSGIQLGSGTDFSSLGPQSGGSNGQQPNPNNSGSGGGGGQQQGDPSGDGGGSAGDGQQGDGGQSGSGSGSSGQSGQNQEQDSGSEEDGQNQQSDKISESNDRLAEDMKSKNTTGPNEKSMTCDTSNDLREQAADAAGIERKSSATQAAARDSVRTRIVQDQNSRSQSSDGSGDEFLMLALKLMGTPKVKWQTILRQSIAKAYGEIMAGKTIRTYRRPNRRFGGGKNQPIFRGSSAIKPTVMIGIDSSGSMSNPDFSAAINEIVSIIKGASKTKGGVEMFCIDTDVKSIEVVNNVNKLNLSGGGGTWMHSGFEFIKSLPNKKQPDIFILATDGYLADEDWEQIYHTVTDPSTKFKTVILITQKNAYQNCPMKLKQATTVIDIHTEKYND